MSSNLPPGVSASDIPGNRPQDVAHDSIWDEAWSLMPLDRWDKLVGIITRLEQCNSAPELHSALIDLVNLWEPAGEELESARILEKEIDHTYIFERFMADIEDAAAKADEFENPPEPEYD